MQSATMMIILWMINQEYAIVFKDSSFGNW
jgi:hypothetical protein